MPASLSNPIILYDGICGLCNRLVRFVLKYDSQDRFRFASLQSDFAAALLRRHGVAPEEFDTMYVVLDPALQAERLVSRSDAAAAVLDELAGGWAALAFLLRMLPRWFRNSGYDLIARNRYRIFGRYDSCPLPGERYRHKFLDQR